MKLLSLSIAAVGGIQASTTTRTLAGELVRFGVPGRTSIGVKRVRAGALRFPDDLTRVKLTKEHFRDQSRGHCLDVEITASGIRAATKVSDGPEGDDALREAADHTRDGFSFDVVDATVVGDEITDALVIAIGQVGIPAYEDSRIDTIAASAAASTGRNTMLSPEQAQRLLELQARIDNGETLSDDDQKEFDALKVLSALQHATPDAGGDAVSASASDQGGVHVHVHNGPAAEVKPEVKASAVPAVPAGGPAPDTSSTTTKPRGALRKMVAEVTAALRAGVGGNGVNVGDISAALTDVISTDHTENIEQGAWSGELWSGLQYEPQFTDLFNQGPLTYFEGRGWRFTTTPEMQDYTGDKAAIPSGTVVTEDSDWDAARMAVGVDVDRKFYDFPNEAFVNGLFEKIRESWTVKLDTKIKAYVVAQAVASTRGISIAKTNADATITAATGTFKASDVGATITGSGIPANTTIASVTNSGSAEMSAVATNGTAITAVLGCQEPTLIKAAARAALTLKRRRVGKASWIYVNDEDLFTLLDVNADAVPAFLNIYGIDPEMFRSSPDIASGSVLAGAKQAAEVKTLPGSPIRVSAQHLANGGIDEAFFGYWAIEEHHTSGIASVVFKPAA